MNINFELYKVFYEVANSKSISKGANKLMISQPAVTQSIQTLEAELGGKLFNRTPKGVVLTSEGQELYNYIKEGMNYFVNGTNKFMSLKNLDYGTLNIGSTTVISENYLLTYIKMFSEKYPNVEIKITNDLTDNLINGLRNGALDIIVTAIPSKEIKDITFNKITELHDIFVGGSKYKDLIYKNIKDMLKEDILLQQYPSNTRVNFNKFLEDNNLSCTPKMEVVSHNLLAKLAENNMGIALLTKEFITDKLDKTLFKINNNVEIPNRLLGYATKKDCITSFTASKFIDLLKNN